MQPIFKIRVLFIVFILGICCISCSSDEGGKGKVSVTLETSNDEEADNPTENPTGNPPPETGGEGEEAPVIEEESFIVTGTLNDASTGLPIESGTTIRVSGDNSDKVVDSLGNPQTHFIPEQGAVSFYIQGATATPENPIRLTVVGEKNGYFSSSVVVNIAEAGDVDFSMNLVKRDPDAAPAGVEIVSQTLSADSTGALPTSLRVETGNSEMAKGKTKVEISSGTILKAADGSPVTGDLTIYASYQNATSGLTTFPGGVENVEVNEGGVVDDEAYFVSGGFTSIEITDESGKQVTQFQDASGQAKPIKLTMEVPKDTKNGDGLPLQLNEEVPIWSYDPETGTWTSEKNGTVVGQVGTNFIVEFEATHLSYWNMDWKGRRCRQGKRINLTTNGEPNTFPTKIRITRASGGGYLFTWSPRYYRGAYDYSFIQMLNTPINVPVNIEIFFKNISLTESVMVLSIANLCSPGVENVDIPFTVPQLVDLTLQANQILAEGTRGMPSASVYYQVNSQGGWRYAGRTDANGELIIPGLSEGKYKIHMYDRLKRKWASKEILLTEENHFLNFDFGLVGFVLTNEGIFNQFQIGGKAVTISPAGAVETPSAFIQTNPASVPSFAMGFVEVGDLAKGTYHARVGIDFSSEAGTQAKILLDQVAIELIANQVSIRIPAKSKIYFTGTSSQGTQVSMETINELADAIVQDVGTDGHPFVFDAESFIQKLAAKFGLMGINAFNLTQKGANRYTVYIESPELSFGTVQNLVFKAFTRKNNTAFVVRNATIERQRAFIISGAYVVD